MRCQAVPKWGNKRFSLSTIPWQQILLCCFVHQEPNLSRKIPHRNRSQVQVSLKVTAQIDDLNITVTLDFFLMFDIFSIDQSPEIAGKLNNYVLDYK